MSGPVLGAVAQASLVAARLELHYASQLVSAAGNTLLEAEANYSHTALSFDVETASMLSADLPNQGRISGTFLAMPS